MGAFRSIRRTQSLRNESRSEVNAGAPVNVPAEPTDPARVVTLDDGTRWLATVVARLVSEDIVFGYGSARLLVRLESLTFPERPARVATVRARELHSVDDEVLRALAATSAVRDSEPPHRNRA
jgi:transposase